jgi:hypothetical protein
VPDLAAKGPGYVLKIAPESVDLHRFRRLLELLATRPVVITGTAGVGKPNPEK